MANEIVNVLEVELCCHFVWRSLNVVSVFVQTVGVVFHIKTGILGLTLLAWANSIGGE